MVEYAAGFPPLSVEKSTPRVGKEAYLIPKPEILEDCFEWILLPETSISLSGKEATKFKGY